MSVVYTNEVGVLTSDKFYNLEKVNSKISSNGFQKLYFDLGNFTLPNSFGSINYWMKLNNQEIFKKNITIEYFSWTKEKYGIKDPILKDSSINEFINLNLSAIRIGHLCGEDLIRAFR